MRLLSIGGGGPCYWAFAQLYNVDELKSAITYDTYDYYECTLGLHIESEVSGVPFLLLLPSPLLISHPSCAPAFTPLFLPFFVAQVQCAVV